MAHHPGQAITEYHVASLVNGAYQKAATVATAVNGFRAAGIHPFDRDLFSEADFAAAITTERAVENKVTDGSECTSSYHIAILVSADQLKHALDLFMAAEAWRSAFIVRRYFKPKDGRAQ
jgi:hypothetical protein